MSDAALIPLIVTGVLVAFPLLWLGIVGLIGKMGWGPLARAYPAEEWPASGYRVSMQSARIGMSNYSNALNAVATPEGLYLRPMVLFRFGHPPVFIPWEAVGHPEPAFLMGVRVPLADGPSLVLYGRLARAVEAAVRAREEASGEAETESGGLPWEAAADEREVRPTRTGGRRRA